jgi:hypothetical protein
VHGRWRLGSARQAAGGGGTRRTAVRDEGRRRCMAEGGQACARGRLGARSRCLVKAEWGGA